MDSNTDNLHLQNLKKYFDRIMNVVEGVSLEDFILNVDKQEAVMFNFIQISEEVKKMSEKYKTMNKDIPWTDIFGLRNKIVHDYGGVKLDIVYNTVINDIPNLYNRLFNK